MKDYPGNVPRAATELAKEWRTDRALRRLEAMVLMISPEHTLLVTGIGDVIQPTGRGITRLLKGFLERP